MKLGNPNVDSHALHNKRRSPASSMIAIFGHRFPERQRTTHTKQGHSARGSVAHPSYFKLSFVSRKKLYSFTVFHAMFCCDVMLMSHVQLFNCQHLGKNRMWRAPRRKGSASSLVQGLNEGSRRREVSFVYGVHGGPQMKKSCHTQTERAARPCTTTETCNYNYNCPQTGHET